MCYNVVMEKIESFLNLISNYAIIAAWGVIILFLILDRNPPQYYKYEQRIKPKKNKQKNINEELEVTKNILSSKNRRIKIYNIVFTTLYFLSIIGSIIFTTLYGLKFNGMVEFGKWALTFLMLYIVFSELNILCSESFKNLKLIVRLIGITLALSLYCIFAYGKPFFYDILIVFVTIILYFCFAKTQYKYISLLLLLGVNLIIIGQKFNSAELKVINDILFAFGTGIVVTGVCNIFVMVENKKKLIKERQYEIDVILFFLKDLMEAVYDNLHKPAKCKESEFYYINYDKFKNNTIKYLDKKNEDVLKVLDQNVIYELESTSKQLLELYNNRRYFIINNIFTEDEIEELYRMYSVPKSIIEDYNNQDNDKLKSHLKSLFDVYDTLYKTVPEIEDLINQFGKDKIPVEYEVGTMKPVWPNGEKVKYEEIYRPITKNNHHNKK